MNQILSLLYIFVKAAEGKGKIIPIPRNTNLEKTYLWRYLNAFYERCLIEGLSEKEMSLALKGLVDESARDGSLRRNGISILDGKNLLDLGIKRLENEVKKDNDLCCGLIQSYDYLIRERNKRKQLSNYDALKHKINHDGYANITCWFLAGKLTTDFIAITTSCRKVIKELTNDERMMLPTEEELNRRKNKLYLNVDVLQRFKKEMREKRCKYPTKQ